MDVVTWGGWLCLQNQFLVTFISSWFPQEKEAHPVVHQQPGRRGSVLTTELITKTQNRRHDTWHKPGCNVAREIPHMILLQAGHMDVFLSFTETSLSWNESFCQNKQMANTSLEYLKLCIYCRVKPLHKSMHLLGRDTTASPFGVLFHFSLRRPIRLLDRSVMVDFSLTTAGFGLAWTTSCLVYAFNQSYNLFEFFNERER